MGWVGFGWGMTCYSVRSDIVARVCVCVDLTAAVSSLPAVADSFVSSFVAVVVVAYCAAKMTADWVGDW